MFLDYSYPAKGQNGWSITFRNPKNFSNPTEKYETPLEACHACFDFVNELLSKNS